MVELKPSGGWRDVFGCHWAAEVFPALSAAELRAMGEDIREHGMINPVSLILVDGDPYVLDGRQRLDSMELIGLPVVVDDDFAPGIKCEFVGALPGFDPVAYVVSLGLRHRHMDETQRAMVAARLANHPSGRTAAVREGVAHTTAGDAAQALNVNVRLVGKAKRVINRGTPELVAAVETGKVKLDPADRIAALPPAEQLAALEAGDTPKPKPDPAQPVPILADPEPEPEAAADTKEKASEVRPGRTTTRVMNRADAEQSAAIQRVSRGELRSSAKALVRIETEDIRVFIDSLMLRRDEMALIPKTERIGLARAFAVALQLVEPAEQQSANPSSWPI